MTVYLTSFRVYWDDEEYVHTKLYDMPAYSIAVYQPEWYEELPKLDLFDIRDKGRWIRPRNFMSESGDDEVRLQLYHDTLLRMYQERLYEWVRGHGSDPMPWTGDVALCCWCPYDKAAKRQLELFGSFVCHSWVVETFLKELGVDVRRDTDRERMVR